MSGEKHTYREWVIMNNLLYLSALIYMSHYSLKVISGVQFIVLCAHWNTDCNDCSLSFVTIKAYPLISMKYLLSIYRFCDIFSKWLHKSLQCKLPGEGTGHRFLADSVGSGWILELKGQLSMTFFIQVRNSDIRVYTPGRFLKILYPY